MKELRDWIDVILKILLTLAGMAVGYYFAFQKQQNDDIKLIAEMATANESAKQIMAASIAQAYFTQKRIPQEFYIAVFSYANNSGDQQLQTVVNTGAAAALKEQPNIQQALTNASNVLPVRIYFHIRQDTDREAANMLEKKIESSVNPVLGNKIVVPGTQLIKGTQTKSLLKCFKKVECEALGKGLVQVFKENNVQIELSDQSAAYEQSTSIRPNHFEAWFAPSIPGIPSANQ
jgi:hypothetical protein